MSGHVDLSRVSEVKEVWGGDECNKMLQQGWTLIDIKTSENDTYLGPESGTVRRTSVVFVMGKLREQSL